MLFFKSSSILTPQNINHSEFHNKNNARAHSRREFMFIGQFKESYAKSRRDCMFLY
jgi:hypothetical protein